MYTTNKNRFYDLILFIILFGIVLLANSNAISFAMVYIEQPPIFLANQQITSWSDLLTIYLSPKMLYATSIPFFRPSSHFLMYQLITPLLGWHNIKGMIIVNYIFLALAGCLIVKLYEVLFPRYKIGGYIAFSFYLMHPALVLPRLIAEHFDFGYVCFSLLSLFYFVLFCQKNACSNNALLMKSILFYIIAVTFKESAIMVGAAILCYFIIANYDHHSLRRSINKLIRNKQSRKIIALIITINVTLACYLSMAWPASSHPMFHSVGLIQLHSASHFLQFLMGTWHSSRPWILDGIHYPLLTRCIILIFLSFILVSSYLIYTSKSSALFFYKNSLTFLYSCVFIFLILPILWAAGMPWHLSLSLVFLSLIIGFSFEFITTLFTFNKKILYPIASLLFLLIGANTFLVNNAHIHDKTGITSFVLSLNHNAILHPPDLLGQINPESMLIVEDRMPIGDYPLGNSSYPYFFNSIPNLNNKIKKSFFFVPDQLYGGTLFRWAYLMPSIKEEIYPFHVNQMSNIPDEIIFDWLKHADNIFCLGYDDSANWQDITLEFKQNLLKEKEKRKLSPFSSINVFWST